MGIVPVVDQIVKVRNNWNTTSCKWINFHLITASDDKIYDEFVERMLAAPIFPTVEREIFSPVHILEPEYIIIESEEFPFSSPIPIPISVEKYYPNFNLIPHSIDSIEYEHESDEDETSGDNEPNNSMANFAPNFTDISINPGATEDSNENLHDADYDSNNSMPEFELNFSDDSINHRVTEGLDSSFTGEW